MSLWLELHVGEDVLWSKYLLPLGWAVMFAPGEVLQDGEGRVRMTTSGANAASRLEHAREGAPPVLVRDLDLLIDRIASQPSVTLAGELAAWLENDADAAGELHDGELDPDAPTPLTLLKGALKRAFTSGATLKSDDVGLIARDPKGFVERWQLGEHVRDTVAVLVMGRPDGALWEHWWTRLKPAPPTATSLPSEEEFAGRFVDMMIARGLLEATSTPALCQAVAAAFASPDPADTLEALLLEHTDVDELYADTDTLSGLVELWG